MYKAYVGTIDQADEAYLESCRCAGLIDAAKWLQGRPGAPTITELVECNDFGGREFWMLLHGDQVYGTVIPLN